MSVGEDACNQGFFRCASNLEVPFFTPSGLDGLSFTLPNFEGHPFTQPNLIATDYLPREPTHFATTKDTVTSATSQVGEQANNDLKLRLPCTKKTEPTIATATARTDRSSSSTGFNDFWSWVMGPDWHGQQGISTECGVALTLNNNNLPVPSIVPVTSAITNTPERRKRGRSTISFEQLQQHFGKTRKKAAEELDVSVSTLKRVARGYGISYWPGPEKNNRVVKKARNCITSSEPDPKKLVATEATNVIQTSLPQATELAMQDAMDVTFKADFGGDSILRFELPSTLKMIDVEQQVAKRLKLKMGSFSISYRDKDECDWVLITCNDDLRRVLPWTTIRIKVAPIAKLMALTSEYN
ncbi:hypothetical protein LguiB_001784 [Lonicera macranthoides]